MDSFRDIDSMPFLNLLSDGMFDITGRMAHRKKQDTAIKLEVTLEDLYCGKTFQVIAPRQIVCIRCNGSGTKSGASSTCLQCRGEGSIMTCVPMCPGMYQQMPVTCKNCRGKGETVLDKDKCRRCKGAKTTDDKQMLKVSVAPGMKHSQKVRFPRCGDQAAGMEPGDVNIHLMQVPHETFKRVGSDLVITLPITICEALCGIVKVIQHLDGRSIVIRTAPGEVTKPGSVKCVIDEGMPLYGSATEKGSLIVKFDVQFPENHFTDLTGLETLEKLLPPRSVVTIIPEGEDVEEVDMFDCKEEDHPSASQDNEQESPFLFRMPPSFFNLFGS